MDPLEYIQSGILEQYVLGQCNEEQMQQVQCMARVFPQVMAELDALQLALSNYASSHAQQAPAHLKHQILQAIQVPGDKSMPTPSGKTITLPTHKNNAWKYAAAACAIMAIGTYFIIYSINSKNLHLNEVVQVMKAQQQQQQVLLDDTRQMLAIVGDSNTTKIILRGLPISTQSFTTVYWNKQSSKVYIAANSLPTPAVGKQYQLWAISNGKPIDLGMLTNSDSTYSPLQEMKNIDNAQAFAITLEKIGGSPTPTIDQMYVLGSF